MEAYVRPVERQMGEHLKQFNKISGSWRLCQDIEKTESIMSHYKSLGICDG